MQEEEYDLEVVTTKLKAMEARRKKWKSLRNAERENLQLPDREITSEFDLAPVDLSTDDSDSDEELNSTNSLPSDDDKVRYLCQVVPIQKSQRRAKRSTLRVTDSLDLSMSVAMMDEVTRSSNANPQAPHSKCADERLTKKSMGSLQQHTQTLSVRHNTDNKRSRIPKLVQQRRQLLIDAHHADASMFASKSVLASLSKVVNDVPSHKGRSKSSPSTNEILKPKAATSITQSKVELTRSTFVAKPRNCGNQRQSVTEDIDQTTAEERQLLQSLEKLDRRLSCVGTMAVAVREGGRQSVQRSNRADSLGQTYTENIGLVCVDEVKKEAIQAAAYGRDGHCKIRRPSSVSARLSSAKRAELSGGVYKSRVRVGGALMNNTGRLSTTDASGKHKVVVKKELTHLLI